MDAKDFKGFFNLVLVILFIAATLLGPLIERWRKKKEAERRRLEGRPEAELEPPPAPAHDEGRPRLPYENVLEEVFGPYIERRRRAAQEASQAPPEEVVEAPEVDPDEEIRRIREARRPAPEPVAAAAREPEAPVQRLAEGAPAEVAHRKRDRSLDEIVFRNPRLSPGAKLLLASEILGNPRARRGPRPQRFGLRG
jgi:type IV secretory pathway VirB10-like protein